jgi:hypothetical protein
MVSLEDRGRPEQNQRLSEWSHKEHQSFERWALSITLLLGSALKATS